MGDSIQVNGVAVTDANFNDTTPVAGVGKDLLLWQRSGSGPDSVSAQSPASLRRVLARTMTDLVFTNSHTNETTLFTYTVPGNTLGTNRALHFVFLASFFDNASATNEFLTVRIKYGGTTLYEDPYAAFANAASRALYLNFWMANQGATNDQIGGGVFLTSNCPATTGLGDLDTDEADSIAPIVTIDGAVDSTVNKDFVLTGQWDTSNSAATITRKFALLMVV